MIDTTTYLIYRLRTRAAIRRTIVTRKSVIEDKPDRICELLDEAADEIYRLNNLSFLQWLKTKF